MPSFRLSRPIVKSCIKLDAEGNKIQDADGNYVYEESSVQESRNHYRFGRAWLVDQYFYTQDYCVTKETRKKNKITMAHIIPESKYPYFPGHVTYDQHNDGEDEDMGVSGDEAMDVDEENEICHEKPSCFCGSKQTCTECNFCGRSMVTEIYQLAIDSVALIGMPHAELRKRESLRIYNKWKWLRGKQYIKGLKVAYVIE